MRFNYYTPGTGDIIKADIKCDNCIIAFYSGLGELEVERINGDICREEDYKCTYCPKCGNKIICDEAGK